MNILKLGQGPRPDILQNELKQNATSREVPESRGRSSKQSFPIKDTLAMMIALFEILLPWIIGIVLVFFVVTFLITRIGP